jgi:hypothetical protein
MLDPDDEFDLSETRISEDRSLGASESQFVDDLVRDYVWPYSDPAVQVHHFDIAPAIVIEPEQVDQGVADHVCYSRSTSPANGPEHVYPFFATGSDRPQPSATPSMTSCATSGSTLDFPQGDTEHFPEVDASIMNDSIFAPLSDTTDAVKPALQLDTRFLGVTRSGSTSSKRPSIDLERSESFEAHSPMKRSKAVPGGFPCQSPSCPKIYNRACDERKHFKNKHTTPEGKAHKCPNCTKRFQYPKDVKRHIRQMHANSLLSPIDPVTPHTAIEGIDPHDHIYHFPAFPPSRPPTFRPRRLSTSLKSVVSMLSSLKLWQSSSSTSPIAENSENYILVTQDQISYRKVYLSGIESAEQLVHKIAAVFGDRLIHPNGALIRHCLGQGRLGKRLVGEGLMSAVWKAAEVGRSLEVWFAPAGQTQTMQSGVEGVQRRVQVGYSWE